MKNMTPKEVVMRCKEIAGYGYFMQEVEDKIQALADSLPDCEVVEVPRGHIFDCVDICPLNIMQCASDTDNCPLRKKDLLIRLGE